MVDLHQDGYKGGKKMKYWDLLFTVGAKTSAPTIDEKVASVIKDAAREAIQEIIPAPQPVMVDENALGKLIDDAVAKHVPAQVEAKPDVELNDKVNMMMQLMKELAEKDNSAPANFDSYALNDGEISQVLTWLLNFQEKYFPNTPLSDTLHQDFMWNIPKEVYRAAYDAEVLGYPDALNPIYWFYMFCLDCPHDMIGEFIMNAINGISDEDSEVIASHAKEYRRVYFDEEESVISPVQPGESSIEDFDADISVETIGASEEE